MCGQTDTKFLDMCGQTDTKFLDMCGQTDTKILDIWDTGTLKKQTKKMGEEEEEKQGLEAAGYLGYRRLKNIFQLCIMYSLFYPIDAKLSLAGILLKVQQYPSSVATIRNKSVQLNFMLFHLQSVKNSKV